MLRAITIVVLCLLSPRLLAQAALPDYPQWQTACAKLPSNRELNGKRPEKTILPLPAFADFDQALDAFLATTKESSLASAANWVGSAPEMNSFFDTTKSWYGAKEIAFQPFAARLLLPADAVAIVMGDLHGDVRSLMAALEELNRRSILDGFRIADQKHHLIFLGDYTDRGMYGVEVLYTLFRLKAANTGQVHLVRGNHEDFNIVSRYGFLDEMRDKYGQSADITKVMRAYDRLPVVMYTGTASDVLQLNHGGMEPGFDPRTLLSASGTAVGMRYQLLGELRQKSFDVAHAGWLGEDATARGVAEKYLRDFTPESPTKPRAIGFMWNDFTVFADEAALGYERSLVFGAGPTRYLLQAASTEQVRVRGVIRAHQHTSELNPLMRRLVACDGAFFHWQSGETATDAGKPVQEIRNRLQPEEVRGVPEGSVWTFNVSPDSSYGRGCGFDFVTFGIVTFAPEFKDWRMRVVKINVF
ncbi:MAG: serine/threonine protein phosphatase [Planctomycetes bacterium]|nr:serine/threonine protein phosphatase [Planctomycetota bacterium]